VPQIIEAPTEKDIENIARQLIHAAQIISQTTGKSLNGDEPDLELIQLTLNAKVVEPEATYSLQALGMAFGKVFVNNTKNYDWWMVEDEFGRDPAIRYKETTLLIFPQTMISKRVEEGQAVVIQEMYAGLCEQLERIRIENYPTD
jgi:hypothetical protein